MSAPHASVMRTEMAEKGTGDHLNREKWNLIWSGSASLELPIVVFFYKMIVMNANG